MSPSIWQILIVGVIILVLFGRGRISEMMGDVGKGISSFKKGLSEEENKTAAPPRIDNQSIDNQSIDNAPRDVTPEKTSTSDKTAK